MEKYLAPDEYVLRSHSQSCCIISSAFKIPSSNGAVPSGAGKPSSFKKLLPCCITTIVEKISTEHTEIIPFPSDISYQTSLSLLPFGQRRNSPYVNHSVENFSSLMGSIVND